MTGKILIKCGPMGLERISMGRSRTDILVAPGTIELADGSTANFTITFDHCDVTPLHFNLWEVAKTTARGELENGGGTIALNLPPEPCQLHFRFPDHLYMVAKKIVATGLVTLKDGSKGECLVTFPDVESHPQDLFLDRWLVNAVDCPGLVVWETP